MAVERVDRQQPLGDRRGQVPIQPRRIYTSVSSDSGSAASSRLLSARSASRWELTDTYSPAAIEVAPPTSPATPASNTAFRDAAAAATPMTRLAVDTIPSFAPSTAGRSQPARPLRCSSRCIPTLLQDCLAMPARIRPLAQLLSDQIDGRRDCREDPST
jgi:microcystin-dependent protein